MVAKSKPESLEGRWDILYRDHPDVYDEFGRIPKEPDFLATIMERFPLNGKVVVDVGSGGGISSFKLAAQARTVIGVEIEEAMVAVAAAGAGEQGVDNVHFVQGDAERIPLADNSVDAALGITLAGGDIRIVAAEMERVVRPGGLVLRGDVAPGWYGGELNPIIAGAPRDETPVKGSRDDILPRLGYDFLDIFMDQDYGTVERAVRTFGFIHSQSAVDHIRKHEMTIIRWKFRAWYRRA